MIFNLIKFNFSAVQKSQTCLLLLSTQNHELVYCFCRIDRPSFKRRDLITFNKIGLHGFNGFSHKGQMRTFGTLLKQFDHTKVSCFQVKMFRYFLFINVNIL